METTLKKTTSFTFAEEVAFEKIWQDMKDASFKVLEDTSSYGVFPCGYGSITIPKRGKFAKWLVENQLAGSTFGPGISLHTYSHNGFGRGGQSYDVNNAIADAMADVLIAAGYKPSINRWID